MELLPSIRTLLATGVLLLFFLVGGTHPASAQTLGPAPDATFGLGGQIGDPSGVSFKFYERPDLAWDFLLAFDLNDDFVFLNGNRVWEQPIQDSPLRYYYGFGAFLGAESRAGDDDVIFGGSFTVGFTLFIERFEVFLNLTPRLRVLPGTRGDLGGGGGLRYYF